MTDVSDQARPSLRVRKRNRTRRDLQRAAIDLVERNGYQATSVDDICGEAEVSRSTLFRYFGSKEAIFQSDLLEEDVRELLSAAHGELTLESLENQICAGYAQLSPCDWDTERRRIRLLQTVPELRTSLADELLRPIPLAAVYIAPIVRLPPDSVRVRTIAGAIIGALAARIFPDADSSYALPATTDEAIEMYRNTFRELYEIFDLEKLRSAVTGAAQPRARARSRRRADTP